MTNVHALALVDTDALPVIDHQPLSITSIGSIVASIRKPPLLDAESELAAATNDIAQLEELMSHVACF